MGSYEKLTKPGEYICYCDQVTEDQILSAIAGGARTPKAIKEVTGAMTHCDCANKHPQGH